MWWGFCGEQRRNEKFSTRDLAITNIIQVEYFVRPKPKHPPPNIDDADAFYGFPEMDAKDIVVVAEVIFGHEERGLEEGFVSSPSHLAKNGPRIDANRSTECRFSRILSGLQIALANPNREELQLLCHTAFCILKAQKAEKRSQMRKRPPIDCRLKENCATSQDVTVRILILRVLLTA